MMAYRPSKSGRDAESTSNNTLQVVVTSNHNTNTHIEATDNNAATTGSQIPNTSPITPMSAASTLAGPGSDEQMSPIIPFTPADLGVFLDDDHRVHTLNSDFGEGDLQLQPEEQPPAYRRSAVNAQGQEILTDAVYNPIASLITGGAQHDIIRFAGQEYTISQMEKMRLVLKNAVKDGELPPYDTLSLAAHHVIDDYRRLTEIRVVRAKIAEEEAQAASAALAAETNTDGVTTTNTAVTVDATSDATSSPKFANGFTYPSPSLSAATTAATTTTATTGGEGGEATRTSTSTSATTTTATASNQLLPLLLSFTANIRSRGAQLTSTLTRASAQAQVSRLAAGAQAAAGEDARMYSLIQHAMRDAIRNQAADGRHSIAGVNMDKVLDEIFGIIEAGFLDAAGPLRLNNHILRDTSTTLQESNVVYEQNNVAMQSQVNAIGSQVNAISGHVGALGSHIGAMSEHIGSVSGNVGTLSTQIGLLQTVLQVLPTMVQQSVEKVVMESLAQHMTEASQEVLAPIIAESIRTVLAARLQAAGVARAADIPVAPLRMKRGCILSKFKKSKNDKQ